LWPFPLLVLLLVFPLAADVEPALVLSRPAPHAVQLVRGQCVLQALGAHSARGANRLGPGYFLLARPLRGDREEQLRIRLLAGGRPPPVAPLLWRAALGGQMGENHAQTPESALSWILS
jgi:hypothetical protein